MGLYDYLTSGIAKAIAVVDPVAARRYKLNHILLRRYDAADASGSDRLWLPGSKSGDKEIGTDWRKVVNKARDLVRNNPLIADAIRKRVAYIVGTALKPQARILKSDNQLDKKLCSLVEERHKLWAENCTIDGKDRQELLELIARHYITDGEALILKVADKTHPYKFQLLEADQLDSSKNQDLKNGNSIVRGIEMNKFGLPVAYWILKAHPGMGYFGSTESKRILANRVIHIFKPERITEHRGICEFVSSIIPSYTHDQQGRAVMNLLRIAAAYGIFVESEYPEDFTFGLPTGTNNDGSSENSTPLKYVDPAGIHYLRKGEKVSSTKPEQPTTGYKEFEQSHLRKAAAGFGMSYETFTGDLSNVNFSSLKAGQNNERKLFRMDSDLLIRKFCLPTYREWLDVEVATGRIQLPSYFQNKTKFQKVKFSLPALPATDPVKEEVSDRAALANGTTSRRIICERKGLDLDDVIADLLNEKKYLDQIGDSNAKKS